MAIQTEYEFTLPKGYVDEEGSLHKSGVMRLTKEADKIALQEDPRIRNNPAYLEMILLSRIVTRLGHFRDVDISVIEGLFLEDISYLQEFYQRINGHSIGSLWDAQSEQAKKNDDILNNINRIKTKSGHEIVFDDNEGQEKINISSKSGHHITLDDTVGDEKIMIEDKSGNSIEMDAVTNKITLKSSMQLSIEANQIDIKADSVLTLQGATVKIN